MDKRRGNSESGQILIVVATALFFVILAAAAVAVDLGNSLLNKQRLQNTADAAALAAAYRIAGGGTHDDAVAAARSIVTQNTSGSVSLPDLGTGSNPGITEGIQVSGADVRVALVKRDVKAFFAGVIGMSNLTVNARARAKANAGEGVMPIAVKRYSAGDTLYQLATNGNPVSVTDYLAQAGHGSVSAWPAPPWPHLLTQRAGSIPDTSNPGPTIAILGSEAVANQAQGNDFHFWVAPDVRNITWSYPPGPTYTNGVTGSSSVQDLKGLEGNYFLPNHPGYGSTTGMPQVGDQIAILNGVDTQNTVGVMKKYYDLGKKVVAMVYDGTVHRKPDFVLQMNPILAQNNHSPDLQPIDFTVTLHQTDSHNLYYGYGVTFSVVGLDSDFASWSFSPNNVDVTGTDRTTTLTITPAHASDPVAPATTPTKTSGARSFLIKAYDTLNHIQRTASAAVMFGNSAAFMATCNAAYQQVEQGSSGQFSVDLSGYNGYPNTTVQIGSPAWVGTAPSGVSVGYTSHNPGSVTSTTALVKNNHTTSFSVYFEATSSASIGEYTLKIPVTDTTVSPAVEQDMYLSVEVTPAGNGNGTTVANSSSFVYILGYAAFEIVNHAGTTSHADDQSNHDHNTVWGRVVSDLASDPSQLTVGSAVRLIGWSQ
jgi:hypothetical protein